MFYHCIWDLITDEYSHVTRLEWVFSKFFTLEQGCCCTVAANLVAVTLISRVYRVFISQKTSVTIVIEVRGLFIEQTFNKHSSACCSGLGNNDTHLCMLNMLFIITDDINTVG